MYHRLGVWTDARPEEGERRREPVVDGLEDREPGHEEVAGIPVVEPAICSLSADAASPVPDG
jgi:hypothetical protein